MRAESFGCKRVTVLADLIITDQHFTFMIILYADYTIPIM